VKIETIITILVNLLTAAFVYGRLTERVKSHGKKIEVLESSNIRHEGEIGELYGIAGANRKLAAKP
jgi:hypothetical protein